MCMDKSIIKIILNYYYYELIITTIIIIIFNIILDFSRNLILAKLNENKVLIFAIILLLSGISSRVHLIKQIWYVTHITVKKKIRRVVYLVIRAAFSC